MAVETLKWIGGIDGYADLIDQTRLPTEYLRIAIRTPREMWHAIKVLQVRGAPAIGIAAGYGIVLASQTIPSEATTTDLINTVDEACNYLATSRPTAVNLFWALDRMKQTAHQHPDKTVSQLKEILLNEALAIHREDSQMCRAIGRNGAHLIPQNGSVLTHCNAGGLATADYGTALAVLYTARELGRTFKVYADETRPLLQGSRLTAWELLQNGIDTTVICDNMAGHLMKQNQIDLVIVGADRIAANGDTANKIGTYSLAVLARAHQIPFYIAAPSSTFDLNIATGDSIDIEERDRNEVINPFGSPIAPSDIGVYNPAFDVTPHQLITAIITEKGLIESPHRDKVLALMKES